MLLLQLQGRAVGAYLALRCSGEDICTYVDIVDICTYGAAHLVKHCVHKHVPAEGRSTVTVSAALPKRSKLTAIWARAACAYTQLRLGRQVGLQACHLGGSAN